MKSKIKKRILPTVTIGIPAFNEGQNIGSLINSILSQRQLTYRLVAIEVVSDGSTDKTNQIVNRIGVKNSIVKLFCDIERKGKSTRMNELFSRSNSDILIILDADITIKDSCLIEKLTDPFSKKNSSHLVSGKIIPRKVNLVAEKIAKAGIDIWHSAIKMDGRSEMYYCNGPVRAFSRSLYTKMRFPNSSADDVYPYIYSAIRKLKFVYLDDAEVYYTLPQTLRDYTKQMGRFIKSESIHQNNFSKEITTQFYTINNWTKFKAATLCFVNNPFWVFIYSILSIYIHTLYLFRPSSGSLWEIINSTKKSNA